MYRINQYKRLIFPVSHRRVIFVPRLCASQSKTRKINNNVRREVVFVLAIGTDNAIVNNVHHHSTCSVVQPCFWNNVYALGCNRGFTACVRLQKDTAILAMTSDD